ncbi:MAG TPA: phosphoribosylformylglycinamidine cyclo-ligase [Bacteroidota bacterium]
MSAMTYKAVGVDVARGDRLIRAIKRTARSTFSRSVLSDIGAFGAFFSAKFSEYKHPVLVSSIDGVGTKLKVALLLDRHDTVGQDLVNHCVNDVLVCGAKPLYFLDYFGTGKLRFRVVQQVIGGMVKACRENGCSLVGGETAELPGIYRNGEYDLAGAIVGVAEKRDIIDGRGIRRGDVLVGLPSTGLHTNGYTLARAVLLKRFKPDRYVAEFGCTVGEELLKVHRSYLSSVMAIRRLYIIQGLSHITGGGIVGNTRRILPKGRTIKVDWRSWERPAVFRLIQRFGSVPEADMRRTFNLGVGLVLVVRERAADGLLRSLRRLKERPFILGEVV